jgi:hypothetical protein
MINKFPTLLTHATPIYHYDMPLPLDIHMDFKYGTSWGAWCSNDAHVSYEVALGKI